MKNLKIFFALTIMVMFVLSSCGKEELNNISSSVKENPINFNRIGFSNNMLVFENIEHVHEVMKQIQDFEIENKDIQDAFPEFNSFLSEYYFLKKEYNNDQLKNKTDVFGSYEKDGELIVKPNILISSGLALICNSKGSIIVENEIIKTTFDKNYILAKELVSNEQDIDRLIKEGNIKDIVYANHSYLQSNSANKRLDNCTNYVSGQNRRLQAELGYFTHYLAVFAYADSNYEKKAGWWWDDITYNSCGVFLSVNSLVYDQVLTESRTINNNDDLVQVSIFLGGYVSSFRFHHFTDEMSSQHAANVSYNGTHSLFCSNSWND